MSLIDDMLVFIQNNQPITFMEIREQFGEGGMGICRFPGCYVSFGLTEEANDALVELLRQEKVLTITCPPELYNACQPSFPIAEEERCYEEIHWLPVVFLTTELIKKGIENCKENNTSCIVLAKKPVGNMSPEIEQYADNLLPLYQ